MNTTTKLTILLTGATDGIGRETARQLTARGHDVIVHGRDAKKVAVVVDALEKSAGRSLPAPLIADFASLQEVRRMGADMNARGVVVDVLLHNAGVFMKTAQQSVDGYELTLAVNHLAPFLLTQLVIGALKKAPQGRVVVVSSVAHQRGALHLESIDDKAMPPTFDGYRAYADSKLMNILFSNELAKRMASTSVTSNALHPGVVSTKLLTEGFKMKGPDSVDEGAATSVFLATDASVATISGRYFLKSKATEPGPKAKSATDALRLWESSAKAVGVDVI
ncbi:MAG: SDR family NAD(P)-dependent oxidoreductase [Deltaproteobacteria bacterium]|nr:SDR family NAD(P)-dependent oxidoreductase [Deltaproteobacteria bacterium]